MPPASLSLLDDWLRGGAAALFLLLGSMLLRQARGAAGGRQGAWFCFGIAAYALQSAPDAAALGPWLVPLQLVSVGNPVLFWLYTAACFDDGFRLSWRHVAAWAGLVGVGALCVLDRQVAVCRGFDLLTLVFVALAIREALAGRSGDLLEARRRFRLVLVALAALITVAVVISELPGHGQPFGANLGTGAGLFFISFVIAFARLRVAAEPETIAMAPALPEAAAPPADAPADPQAAPLLTELERLMREERIYREPGLGIGGLAGRLGIPEYRLRRLINQRLGQRNFSAFINGYRLAEAKAALADPTQAAVPILTIALDAGFQSLGPFNRAFRSDTGITPSDFRRQATLGETSPIPKTARRS